MHTAAQRLAAMLPHCRGDADDALARWTMRVEDDACSSASE